jgi:hypothetical protein
MPARYTKKEMLLNPWRPNFFEMFESFFLKIQIPI